MLGCHVKPKEAAVDDRWEMKISRQVDENRRYTGLWKAVIDTTPSIDFDIWEVTVACLDPVQLAMEQWCIETFGASDANTVSWRWRLLIEVWGFEFTNERDVMLFKLAWNRPRRTS